MDGLSWLSKNNRKITINKRTLFDIVAKDFSIDDVMTEALTNHLQRYIHKLGYGKQSVDWKSIGNIQGSSCRTGCVPELDGGEKESRGRRSISDETHLI